MLLEYMIRICVVLTRERNGYMWKLSTNKVFSRCIDSYYFKNSYSKALSLLLSTMQTNYLTYTDSRCRMMQCDAF